MEKGVSEAVMGIHEKLGNPNYVNKAVDIISEQLLGFFNSEWNLED